MTTAESYAARIERVATHIWDNLDAPLDLDRLAAVACFSPYHFHRIYRMTMGETAAQTVRRLRLHRAAVQLSDGTAPLDRVARAAGYGSAEAFSRAFSAAYGCPPAAYRSARTSGCQPPGQERIEVTGIVTLIDAPALRLAGFPHRGDYQTIGAAFDRLYAWAGPRGLVTGETRHIGVFYGEETVVDERDLRSFAGISVAPDFAPADGVEVIEIPAGPTAVLRHKGPYAELEGAYGTLYGVWLPGSGRDPADQPCFEDYLNDPRQLPPTELLTDIHLPLMPEPGR